jgi:hypothetical protein
MTRAYPSLSGRRLPVASISRWCRVGRRVVMCICHVHDNVMTLQCSEGHMYHICGGSQFAVLDTGSEQPNALKTPQPGRGTGFDWSPTGVHR